MVFEICVNADQTRKHGKTRKCCFLKTRSHRGRHITPASHGVMRAKYVPIYGRESLFNDVGKEQFAPVDISGSHDVESIVGIFLG